MSTLTTRDAVVRDAKQTASPNVKRRASKRFSLIRLLAWYRAAVLGPATGGEKAEWQKNSF